MSHPLVRHSPDLQRLVDEAYHLEIRDNYLLVHHVPFVTSEREVAYGTIVSELSTNGEQTIKPADHVVHFVGGVPCDKTGAQLTDVVNNTNQTTLANGLTADCMFSNQPRATGYDDYHEMITSYINMLAGAAEAIEPTATARVGAVETSDEDNSVFGFLDSASSRARISHISAKLRLDSVAIVGLGGTGSFILDLLAKTEVQEIHLFDGDTFYAHNAFRAPGAASLEELRDMPNKAAHHATRYAVMRRGVIAHPVDIDEGNLTQLQEMQFVFLAMDPNPAKRAVVRQLEEWGIPFIDAGMGVSERNGSLAGILTVTASTPRQRQHVWDHSRIVFDAADDEYERNIQIADLNALNAVLAVIRFKKWCGFYVDDGHEHFMAYTTDANHLVNEDRTA